MKLDVSFQVAFIIEMKYFVDEGTFDAFYFFVELVLDAGWQFTIWLFRLCDDAFKFLQFIFYMRGHDAGLVRT